VDNLRSDFERQGSSGFQSVATLGKGANAPARLPYADENWTAAPAISCSSGGLSFSRVHPVDSALHLIPIPTLLERGLPFRELSLIARADRRAVDPVYATHRWWARRPPGVIRGLLLASVLPANTKPAAYWERFASPATHLAGVRVHDMFAGGGAMLVEAARLGATPSGTDVDPLAVEIIRHELQLFPVSTSWTVSSD
jgi:hypothetical protein